MSRRRRAAKMAGLMDSVAELWLFKTAHQHHWRVAQWMEVDDLIADGYCLAAKLRSYYPQVRQGSRLSTSKRQFMALFKRSFLNHINQLASTTVPETPLSHLMVDGELPPDVNKDYLSVLSSEFSLDALLEKAPREVKAFFKLFGTKAGLELLRSTPSQRNGLMRETTNERICRILSTKVYDSGWRWGFDPHKLNIVELVQTSLLV